MFVILIESNDATSIRGPFHSEEDAYIVLAHYQALYSKSGYAEVYIVELNADI